MSNIFTSIDMFQQHWKFRPMREVSKSHLRQSVLLSLTGNNACGQGRRKVSETEEARRL